RRRGHVRCRALDLPGARSGSSPSRDSPSARIDMTVLVVGGAGYIGSVVVEELVRGRNAVLVLDDLSTGHTDAVAPLPYLIEGTLADDAKLAEAFTTKEIDCVIHLAARSIVADSVSDPGGYETANVTHSVRLLDAMRAHGVRHIVFSSSAAV